MDAGSSDSLRPQGASSMCLSEKHRVSHPPQTRNLGIVVRIKRENTWRFGFPLKLS